MDDGHLQRCSIMFDNIWFYSTSTLLDANESIPPVRLSQQLNANFQISNKFEPTAGRVQSDLQWSTAYRAIFDILANFLNSLKAIWRRQFTVYSKWESQCDHTSKRFRSKTTIWTVVIALGLYRSESFWISSSSFLFIWIFSICVIV